MPGLNTLIDFRYTQHFRAPRGKGGAGPNRTGAGGDDLVVRVPIGTQILADDEDRTLLADLTKEGQRVTLLQGGIGGRGNASYKTSTNRAPRQHQTGTPGEEDGCGCASNCSPMSAWSGCPTPASRPSQRRLQRQGQGRRLSFHHASSELGVVRHKGVEFVLADIPGLIEGAAEGAGIGDRFLGHVERTRILMHLVDASD